MLVSITDPEHSWSYMQDTVLNSNPDRNKLWQLLVDESLLIWKRSQFHNCYGAPMVYVYKRKHAKDKPRLDDWTGCIVSESTIDVRTAYGR